MTTDEARQAFERQFAITQTARRAWRTSKAAAAIWQEKAFAAQIDYYEEAEKLEDAQKAWDRAERVTRGKAT